MPPPSPLHPVRSYTGALLARLHRPCLQDLFEAQAQVQQSLWLDLKEVEAVLARSDGALPTEIACREQQRRLAEQVPPALALVYIPMALVASMRS